MSLALEITRVRQGVSVSTDPRRDPWSFVAIDPGAHGAIVWSAWEAPGTPRALLVCPIRDDYPRVRAWIARNRPHLLRASAIIIEEALGVGDNPAGGTIQQSATGGMLAGALSWTLGLPISYLPPASWQVILGPDRLTKIDGKTTQTKPRAQELAERFFVRHHGGSLASYTKKDAEGVADALGMSVWRVMALARDLGLFEEGSTTWCESAFSSASWFRSLRDKPKRRRAKR